MPKKLVRPRRTKADLGSVTFVSLLDRQRVDRVRRPQLLIDLLSQEQAFGRHPVPARQIQMLLAERDHPSKTERTDDVRLGSDRSPLPEADRTDQAQSFRVGVLRAIAELVLDHPSPQRDPSQ